MRKLMAVIATVLLVSGTGAPFAHADQSDLVEIKSNSSIPGYAIFENRSASTYTDDNAQSVFLIAPASVPNGPLATPMLLNVQPVSSTFYLLQAGLHFQNGTGTVGWTSTFHDYSEILFDPNIPYVASHHYWFIIKYEGGVWKICARDVTAGSLLQCVPDSAAPGTTMQAGVNTSVWLETHNKTPNWFYGFGSLQAYGAKLYRNGVPQNWSIQHRHTLDSCSTTWPPANALSGSLTGSGTATFLPSATPFACPVQQSYLPDVKIKYGGWDSKFIVSNNSSSQGNLAYTYYDTAGNPVRSSLDTAVGAFSQLILPSLPSVFSGFANVGVQRPISVVVESQYGLPIAYIADSYNGIAASDPKNRVWGQVSASLYAPVIMNDYYGWYTQIILLNADTVAALPG